MPKSSHLLVSRYLTGVALAAFLQGCGTPQPLLDQANNGAALSMSLQAELENFRAVQGEIAQVRLGSIRRQLASIATYQIDSDFDERVKKSAGTATSAQLYADLRALADSRGADEKLLAQQLAQIDADLGKVIAPLPETAKALEATQRALAVMGEELSPKDRLKAVAGFAKQIRAGIEDNKKRIDDAKAKATDAAEKASQAGQ